ncbi:YiiX family permuted papain-like enzyme [Flavobacterium sp.]|uniref:YiiX family permuted papain-like enzyme n=1 Tax=Flavobacterium sp. TaxID=239 RepID=UPI00374FF92A
MKATKIIFAIVTLGISFYFALRITNFIFEKKNYSKNETAKPDLKILKDGDMIFQTSQSSQCEAVRIATNSKFSHCGIIYIINGEKFVYEAVQPVKLTKFEDWITHGENNDYVVKRLKNASTILSVSTLKKMKDYGNQFMNKNYDLYFEWSDDKIYCSELLWKIYKNGAGIELCKLEKLKNFNLKNQTVQNILKERYGNNVPLEENVVAPLQIVDSKIVETIIDTY